MLESNFSLPLKWTELEVVITADGATNGQPLTDTETPYRAFFIMPYQNNSENTKWGPTAAAAIAEQSGIPAGGAFLIPYLNQPGDLRDWFVSGAVDDRITIRYM